MSTKTFAKVTLGALLLAVLLGGVAWGDVKDDLTYQGKKARITVGSFKAKASECGDEEAAALGEMLSTALVNTGKFIVLASQEEVAELAEEIDLAESGYVEEGRGPEKGLMEGADLLITGAVTTFEPDAGGGGGGLGAIGKKAFGAVGVSSQTAKIAVEVKLIDIRTRRIIKAETVKSESKKWNADMAGGGWVEDVALVGGLSSYDNQPMADAIRASLAETVQMISKEVPQEYYRYQGSGQYSQQYGESGTTGGGPSGSSQAPSGGGSSSSGGPAKAAAADMALYTKYDFVPGEKTLYYDDLTSEEVGEFPSRWRFLEGVFEVAGKGDRKLIMCSDRGLIAPKMATTLPGRFTVEMEIFSNGVDQRGHFYHLNILDKNENRIAQFSLTDGENTALNIFDKQVASKALPSKLGKGIHTMRVMATASSLKCYVDNERVANVPDLEYFEPAALQVECDPWDEMGNPMLMGSFRVAEGGKSMREQLDATGKIITHGILFDPDSYVIKGESYKTLAEIGDLLNGEASLRLSIQGHTDADGGDDHNLELSRNRAGSVRDYLIATYGIDGNRLEATGLGETQPIDNNTSAEGKANNRRVELVKL